MPPLRAEPYSQAIVGGGLVFCSGMAGIDPATGAIADGIEARTEQALLNPRLCPAPLGRPWTTWLIAGLGEQPGVASGRVARALLIIDMQEAVRPAIWRFEQLAGRIAALAREARENGVPVIAIQQTGPPGSPFDPETPGWQLSTALGVHDSDLRLRKSAIDSFYATDLADLLVERAIGTVIITGAATDYCVDATARAALSHRLNVDLVSDGHAPAAKGDPEAGLTPEQSSSTTTKPSAKRSTPADDSASSRPATSSPAETRSRLPPCRLWGRDPSASASGAADLKEKFDLGARRRPRSS